MIQTSIEGSLHGSFFDVEVKNPRTHIKKGKAQFTDYEIHVQTNHPHFPLKESKVRRRYSEFGWLRQRLGSCKGAVAPPLLPASALFGKFKNDFILERMRGFEQFLQQVVEEKLYLMEPSLHMFLQTDLSTKEMDRNLNRKSKREIRYIMVQLHHKRIRTSSIIMSCKSVDVPCSIPDTGRGWSRGAISGATSLPELLDKPDGVVEEACALPGGQITVYEADDGVHTTDTDTEDDCFVVRSWHGKERDLVDLWLEEYDIIPFEAIVNTETGVGDSPVVGLPSESSDDGKSNTPEIKMSSACDITQAKKIQMSTSLSGSPPWVN